MILRFPFSRWGNSLREVKSFVHILQDQLLLCNCLTWATSSEKVVRARGTIPELVSEIWALWNGSAASFVQVRFSLWPFSPSSLRALLVLHFSALKREGGGKEEEEEEKLNVSQYSLLWKGNMFPICQGRSSGEPTHEPMSLLFSNISAEMSLDLHKYISLKSASTGLP